MSFTTSNKPPDFSHRMPNGTEKNIIVNGQRTTEADEWRDVISGTSGSGFSVTMSCPAAQPHHAGTYIGTDNDDAENAQKTVAHVVVVKGR